MAIKKLSFITVLKSVINKIEQKTNYKAFDDIPLNNDLPYYFVEIIGQTPNPSKTMFKEIYEINIHVFAKGGSSVDLYNAIQDLEEALTEKIIIPVGYDVVMQIPKGILQIMTDEDGEKHAVIGYEFEIFYGYNIK